jgi:hypothetical protein
MKNEVRGLLCVLTARYLNKGLLVVVLSLVAHAAALASPCGDAARNYNRIVKLNDDWYIDARERATGLPASSKGNIVYCSKLLPIYRERLRRQQAVMEAYRAWQSACINPREEDRREGVEIQSASGVMQTILDSIQICERALNQKHN